MSNISAVKTMREEAARALKERFRQRVEAAGGKIGVGKEFVTDPGDDVWLDYADTVLAVLPAPSPGTFAEGVEAAAKALAEELAEDCAADTASAELLRERGPELIAAAIRRLSPQHPVEVSAGAKEPGEEAESPSIPAPPPSQHPVGERLGLSDSQRLAIVCGNADYADTKVCPNCDGKGYLNT